jgi:hypothetical protein
MSALSIFDLCWMPIGSALYVWCYVKLGRHYIVTKVVYRITVGVQVLVAALERDILGVVLFTLCFLLSLLWRDDDDDDEDRRSRRLELKTKVEHLIENMKKLRPSSIPLPQPV